MVVTLNQALDSLEAVSKTNEEKACEDNKRKEVYVRKAGVAYDSLLFFTGSLAEDQRSRRYFRTNSTLPLFKPPIRNGHPVDLGYIEREGRVYVAVGSVATESRGDFIVEFDKYSGLFVDESQRDAFLDGINNDSVLEAIANYPND